jgi:ABC-type multidrug transport system ATPase subunit
VIAVEGATARSARARFTDVTLTWSSGVHAIVGRPEDGGPLLLAAVAGLAPLRRGRARLFGRAPTDAGARARIARIPMDPPLPGALRVAEYLSVAAHLRGESVRPAEERLSSLGIEALAPRLLRSLSLPEARSVALAEAGTSTRVQALFVEEPNVLVDPRAAGRVATVLRNKARGGCVVVVATASLRDAAELATDFVLLRAGSLIAHLRSIDEVAGFSPEGAELRVLLATAADARAMIAGLAHDASVEGIERDEATVRLRGPDATWLARAAAAAAIEAGIDVLEIGLGVPPLDEARAVAAGIAAATYEAAYRRARAAAAAPADTRPPDAQGTA